MQVGQAEILVKLQDAGLKRELSAAERKVLATMKRISAMRGEAEIDADIKQFEAKIAAAKAQIAEWERERAEATLDADISAAEEGILEARALAAQWEGQKFTATLELETRRDLDNRLRSMVNRFGNIKQSADEADTILGRWARNLSNMTLRLGPFSASLRQFGLALTLLGPIINSIVGSLGALLAVTASGLAGVMVGLGAGLTGAAMAGTGLLFVLKPLIGDYKDATTAARAYDNAVKHHGKNSEQAQKKLEQYNQTLKGTNAVTRTAFLEVGKLSGAWGKLTEPARAQGLNLIAQGIKTATALMPGFAARTNEVAKMMSDGLTGWMRGLRSGEGKGIIDAIFGNFNAAVPALLRSLGSLGTFFGRTFAIAAESLRPAAEALARWTQSLANAAKTGGFRAAIKTMIGDAGRLVNLLGGAGDLLLAFTGAGRKTGAPMLEAITKQLHDWAAAIREGALDQFFQDAQSMIGKVVQGVGSLISALYNLSRVLTPIVAAMLSAFDVVAKVVAAILGLRVVQSVTPYIAALAAAFLLARKALLSFGVTLEALAVARGIAASLGLVAPAAAATAAEVTAAGTAATGAGAALAGLGAGALGFIAPLTVGIGILAYKLITAKDVSDQLNDSFRKTADVTKQLDKSANDYSATNVNMATALRDQNQAVTSVADAKQRLNALDNAGKRGTQEWRDALSELNAQIERRTSAQGEVQKLSDREANYIETFAGATIRATSASEAYAVAQGEVKRIQAQLAALKDPNRAKNPRDLQDITRLENALSAALRDQATAKTKLSGINRELSQAQNIMAAASMNQARALQGMIPLAGAAEQALGRLARAGRAGQQIAAKISIKYPDPADVQRVSQQARQALGAGVSKSTVLKIIADSRSAEQAIARLQAKRLDPKLLSIVEKGGDQALRKLELILGRKLTPKEQRIFERGGEAAMNKLAEIVGFKMPNKQVIIRAIDNATMAISAVAGALAALNGRTATVTTIHKDVYQSVRKLFASGRTAGRAQTAMVGEGGGPEYVGNPDKGFVLVGGPTIMPLTSDDYVIPTERRYRDRARELMAQMAQDMGIETFADGKGATAAKKKKRAKKKRWIPREHRFDADPDDLKSNYEDAKDRYEKIKKDKKASAKQKANARRRMTDARKTYIEARNYDRRIEKAKSGVEDARQDMTLADQIDDQAAYDTARGRRAGLLKQLINLYRIAYRGAPTGPWKRALLNKLKDARIDLGENATETMDVQPPAEMTLEGYLASFAAKMNGVGVGELNRLKRAYALAQANTPDNLEDDKTTAEAIASFYERVLGVAQAAGLPDTVVTEAADALVSARGIVKGLQGGQSDNPDVQAQFDQYKARYNATAMSQFVDASVARIFGDTSPTMQSPAGATQVVFQSYVPPSPAEALRLADYTVGGMSYQSTGSSSVEFINA